MEPLQFNFSHPVTGKIRLVHQSQPSIIRVILLQEEEAVDVPLAGLCSGPWKAMLEWEYEGRDFSIHRPSKSFSWFQTIHLNTNTFKFF